MVYINCSHYELCSHPSSLFDAGGLLREANKSVLADAIWKRLGDTTNHVLNNCNYVLDGGSLLQSIPWKVGSIYDEICTTYYVDYVSNRFGVNATVVFDGSSEDHTTKDMTHNRRSHGNVGPTVHFTKSMNMKKDVFLCNKKNKQQFINLLAEKLRNNVIEVIHSSGDADLLIVQTAMDKLLASPTTAIVGSDTDLLILLCHYSNDDTDGLFMVSDTISKMGKRQQLGMH